MTKKIMFNIFFILLWFITPIFHFTLFFDSLRGCLLISTLILILTYLWKFKSLPRIRIGTIGRLIFILFLIHSFISFFINDIDIFRLVSSFILFCFILYTSLVSCRLLANYDSNEFHNFINIIYYSFILLFAFSLVNPIVLTKIHLKPIFPYNEPSHFCLFFGPIMYYKLITSKGKLIWIFAILSIIIALFTQNLIIILSTFIVFGFINYKKIILLSLVIFVSVFMLLKSEYFSSRLNISKDSNNISVLAFIQGWDFAYNHSINTNFFGIGFQQLGFVPVETETSIQIDKLIDGKLNEKDGSFDASKIISEFGIFGIFILLIYFKFLFKCLKLLSKSERYDVNNSVIIFCCCSVFSFFIEIFIRGVGYFSPTFFLFITSLFYLTKSNKFFYLLSNKIKKFDKSLI